MAKLTILNLQSAREAELERQREAAAARPLKTAQALGPQLFTLGGGMEDAGYRRISSSQSMRDLNPLMQQRMQQVSYYLSVTNPLAKQIVKLITSYVVGEGFTVTAEDPDVQAVINRFWNDDVNKMKATVRAWSNELAIFGELVLPVAVNPVDGFTRIAYVDPQDVETIEYGLLQTGDERAEVTIPVAVRLKQRMTESSGRRLMIIRREEDVNSPTFGLRTGDTFYQAINKAKGASRGISDLFCLADWVDVIGEMNFDFADRVRILNGYIWDYCFEGADQKAINEYMKEIAKNPPKQGGFQAHNEKVKITAVTPDLKGADMAEAARVVTRFTIAGAGMPPTWFGDPTDANRSTAQEMEGPPGKILTDRQNELRDLICTVLDFVLDQAQAHGVLGAEADRKYDVQTPDLMIKDLAKGATVLQTAANALALAEDRGWVRGITAARAFVNVLTQIGTKIDDAQAEYETAQQEKTDSEASAINALNDQQKLADALRKVNQPALPPAPGEGVVQ